MWGLAVAKAMNVRSRTLKGRSFTATSNKLQLDWLSEKTVWPSGFDWWTSRLAGTVLPPGLLMTFTGTPHFFFKLSAISRPTRSVEPPGTNGTMISIALLGYFSWAWTGATHPVNIRAIHTNN